MIRRFLVHFFILNLLFICYISLLCTTCSSHTNQDSIDTNSTDTNSINNKETDINNPELPNKATDAVASEQPSKQAVSKTIKPTIPEPQLPSEAYEEKAKTEAKTLALHWLTILDQGQYAASYTDDKMAQPMRDAVTEDEWVAAMKQTRGTLGALKERNIQTITYTDSQPGAPQGEYVTLIFYTSFENDESTVETITPMKPTGSDTWAISGYYINLNP